jgi:hypothetical protein
MSRSKAKGTAAETAVVRAYIAAGAVYAERRALSGVLDRGDVAGVPGIVTEVKNVSRDGLPGWLDEAEAERVNAGADLGVVWHKRRGKADPLDWPVSMLGRQWLDILRLLGYLPEAADE